MDHELAIIGAGPAGLSAAIYASRAGIDTVVIDKQSGGGMVQENPRIENYLGFPNISGVKLADKFKTHAQDYAQFKYNSEVLKITPQTSGFKLVTDQEEMKAQVIILATGTKHRNLEVKGEEEYRGRGVSYCATCDGPLFNGKDVAVVGGGSTALTEGLFLREMDKERDVYLIHRRDLFRGEQALVKRVKEKGIQLAMNRSPVAIYGNDFVSGIRVKDVNSGEQEEIPCQGVFIAIGEIPQSSLAEQLEVELDPKGYIITDQSMETNVPGIYAAGDVTGGIRQIVTAVAEGAAAALNCLSALGKEYPY